MDTVRVLRIVEIVGPRDLVEKQVASSLHGMRLGAKSDDGQVVIRAATIGEYPEVLDLAVMKQEEQKRDAENM